MKLQRGKFTIDNIKDLDKAELDPKDGIRKVIDLDYMGQFEYEGNTIPILRMWMQYYGDNYVYQPLNVFSKNGKQMYVFYDSNSITEEEIEKIIQRKIEINYSLYSYINYPDEEFYSDFWWDINSAYMIFFGEEKKDLIEYFLNTTLERDGGKEGIKRKLISSGIKLK